MSDSPSGPKKTIYVDVDEEITGIIDKVKTGSSSIVALVLPKRATMLQSIVNMKLLKRAADQADKKVVLITSESTLMPLASAAGLYVAANLQSRPYLPAATAAASTPITEPLSDDPEIDPATPVGDMESTSKAAAVQPIEIDNRPKPSANEAKAAAASQAKPKTPKDKSKRIPNFQKFRVLLFAGAGLLLLLIVFGYWAFFVAPKAKITLRTESSQTPATAEFTADTEADEIDLEADTLPAQNRELKKTETEKVAATGEKDNGTKAGGTVKLRNCTDDEVTIPAGTGISNGSFTFITQGTVELNDDKRENGNCVDSASSTKSVNVIAQKNGDQYNLSPRTYTVSGYGGVVANGEQMNGGTTKTVKIVAPADIEQAKKRISDKQNAVVEEIKNDLKEDGYIGLVDTFSAGTGNFTPTPAVNSEANEVTVSGEVTYMMLGVKESDLKKIVEAQSKDQVDTSKQAILNYGFDDATYEVGKKGGSRTDITIKTTLVAGPEIKQDDLKRELAGKKRGDAEGLLKSRPGITEVKVETSPFWVSKVPGKAAKVNFVIEQADGTPLTQ